MDGEAFGAAEAEVEEEFMTLREVLFAELGVKVGVAGEQGEVGEEVEDEEDDDEEEETKTVTVEQELDFKAFVNRFAIQVLPSPLHLLLFTSSPHLLLFTSLPHLLFTQRVVEPFATLFSNYSKNSKDTNYQIIKMFHRIAFDCGLPAILFQAAIFRWPTRLANKKRGILINKSQGVPADLAGPKNQPQGVLPQVL